MGMAASQARYLALSARKTNCEYEGQQINQQRLNLSNQSADLFNQMLTMSVPMPPSSTEFTKLQYSWSDGNTTSVIDEFYQIGEPNEDYNYVVSSYHYENAFTGQKKYMSDPQVQAKKTNHFDPAESKKHYNRINEITYNKDKDTYTFDLINSFGNTVTSVFRRADDYTNVDTFEQLDAMSTDGTAAGGANYKANRIVSQNTLAKNYMFDETADTYTYNNTTPETTDDTTFTRIDLTNARPETMKALRQAFGATYDPNNRYYVTANLVSGGGTDDNPYVYTNAQFICGEDIDANAHLSAGTATVRKADPNDYFTDGIYFKTRDEIQALDIGQTLDVYTVFNNPTFSDYEAVGNCALTAVSDQGYTDDQTIDIEIQQLLKDLKEGGDEIAYSRLKACFDDAGNYIPGSLYTFSIGGQRYFTTAGDLNESLMSAFSEQSVAENGIDSQQKRLSYYRATYVNKKVSEVKKVLLETDGQGRFSTARFQDDSVTYTLNVETIKDEDAYNDAMNKYYYDKERYDKQVADINAKTEIIQAQDKQLQLKLEQLGTEQTALQTEMEAVQKVVQKSIEGGFKTFGG